MESICQEVEGAGEGRPGDQGPRLPPGLPFSFKFECLFVQRELLRDVDAFNRVLLFALLHKDAEEKNMEMENWKKTEVQP